MKNRTEQNELIIRLAKLGWTIEEIAQAAHCAGSTVSKRLRQHRTLKKRRQRTSRPDAYRATFLAYIHEELSLQERKALQEYLRIRELEDFASGIIAGYEILCNVTFSPRNEGYERIYKEVHSRTFLRTDRDRLSLTPFFLWAANLPFTPSHHEELIELIRRYFGTHLDRNRIFWQNEEAFVEFVEGALSKPPLQKIASQIRDNYGLGRRRRAPEEIATHHGISVRELREDLRTFRRTLRTPENLDRMASCVQQVGQTMNKQRA